MQAPSHLPSAFPDPCVTGGQLHVRRAAAARADPAHGRGRGQLAPRPCAHQDAPYLPRAYRHQEDPLGQLPGPFTHDLLRSIRACGCLTRGRGLRACAAAEVAPIRLFLWLTRICVWGCVQEICTCMGRLLDHVKQFVEAELGTEGSVDGNHRLVLRYATPYYENPLYRPVIKGSTRISRTPRPCSS